MSLSVVLYLSRPVTVPDLKRFLSLVPEGIDETQDIRRRHANEETTGYLEFSMPTSEREPA